ncbi:MAG: hypothetical protein AAF514_04170 [Verrucomicrobiota bacterium]
MSRGPGTAPITLGEESDVGSDNLEGVSNLDLRQAAIGDVMTTREGQHSIDETPSTPQQGGEVRVRGQGGEQVWQEQLLPSEKEVLKRYFK